MNENSITINLSTEDIDKAIEKAQTLKSLLLETKEIAASMFHTQKRLTSDEIKEIQESTVQTVLKAIRDISGEE